MKVISIKQPWASLIMSGLKDVENRSWKINGTPCKILIHCGGNIDKPALTYLEYGFSEPGTEYINAVKMGLVPGIKELPRRSILGYATITKCESGYPSIWSSDEPGQIQWVFEDVFAFDQPITDVKGQLGVFSYPLDENSLPSAHRVGENGLKLQENNLILPVSDVVFKNFKKGFRFTLELTHSLRQLLHINENSTAIRSIQSITVHHGGNTKSFSLDDVYIIKARDKSLTPVEQLSESFFYEIVFTIGNLL